MILDPTKTRLSEHFLLSDLMGCSSIYSRGIANVFDKRSGFDIRLENGRALCEYILEPIVSCWGPVSVSYGFISPQVSRAIVTYQDPNKPSYHRWDAGAAADILIHEVCTRGRDNLSSSPIYAAHKIDHELGLPYSRLITYSESPYVCIAAQDSEIREWHQGGVPRRAFYENRYTGRKGAKPKYINMRSDAAKKAAYEALKKAYSAGEDFAWRGAGYPTYHGGGRRQLHHIRVSKYTMVTDWLFDAESVAKGYRNNPCLTDPTIRRSFAAAGVVYDRLMRCTDSLRYSIIQGYVAPHNPGIKRIDPVFDWRNDRIGFLIAPPVGGWDDTGFGHVCYADLDHQLPGVRAESVESGILFTFEVEDVIQSKEWKAYRADIGADFRSCKG